MIPPKISGGGGASSIIWLVPNSAHQSRGILSAYGSSVHVTGETSPKRSRKWSPQVLILLTVSTMLDNYECGKF